MSLPYRLANAEWIGAHALRVLNSDAGGEVAAVFRRSAYVCIGTGWACIGAEEVGAGPLNILSDVESDWRALVEVGEPAKSVGGVLRLGQVRVAISGARIWAPPPPPRWTAQTVREGMALLDDLLFTYRPPSYGLGYLLNAALASPSAEARAAASVVADLSIWFNSQSPAAPVAGPLLGLGPGLTPSGDDYLAGALGSLHALGHFAKRDQLWGAIAQELPGATGSISAAHLRSAAEGQLSEQQHMLMNALLSADEDRLPTLMAALARDMHTSSWDGLAGIAAVFRAFASSSS